MPTLEFDARNLQAGALAGPEESSIKLTCHWNVQSVYLV